MKRLGLARNQLRVWTFWLFFGKFRLVLKKNRTWILLECCIPTRAVTIETGLSRFPGFRVNIWRPLW